MFNGAVTGLGRLINRKKLASPPELVAPCRISTFRARLKAWLSALQGNKAATFLSAMSANAGLLRLLFLRDTCFCWQGGGRVRRGSVFLSCPVKDLLSTLDRAFS